MSTTADSAQTVEAELQKQGSNAYALYANFNRYHWLATGLQFNQYHLCFEEIGNAMLGTIDELGERIMSIGHVPKGTSQELIALSTIKSGCATGSVKPMLAEALANHQQVAGEMKTAFQISDGAGDPGSADTFTRILQIHE